MRPSSDRTHADQRLPVFLRLQKLRPTPQTEAGRLLRLLLLWVSTLSAETGCSETAGLSPEQSTFKGRRRRLRIRHRLSPAGPPRSELASLDASSDLITRWYHPSANKA